jgi:hypothetical protein
VHSGKTSKEKEYKRRIAKLERELGEVVMVNEFLKKRKKSSSNA